MGKFQCLFLLLLLAITSSCASIDVFKTSELPKNDKSYIFGRFKLTYTDLGYSLGLGLQNIETKKSKYLLFSKTNELSCIEVDPGFYKIATTILINRHRELLDERTFKPPFWMNVITTNFFIGSNEGIYIGDFYGSSATRLFQLSSDGNLSSGIYWSILVVSNEYSNSTKRFKTRFPSFVSIVNRTVY